MPDRPPTSSSSSYYQASAPGSRQRAMARRGSSTGSPIERDCLPLRWCGLVINDSQWIAFSMANKARGAVFQLYLMHPDGSEVRQLTSAGRRPIVPTSGVIPRRPTAPVAARPRQFRRRRHLVDQRRWLAPLPGHPQASRIRDGPASRLAALKRLRHPPVAGRASASL